MITTLGALSPSSLYQFEVDDMRESITCYRWPLRSLGQKFYKNTKKNHPYTPKTF